MKTSLHTYGRRLWKPVLGVLGLGVLIVWTTGIGTDRVEPGRVPHAPGRPLPGQADTFTVTNETVRGRVPVIGTVASDRTVQLTARIRAHVAAVHLAAGDSVETEELLIELDERDGQAKRSAATAAVHRARTEFERTRKLHAAQAATEQQLIAAESAFHSARAQLDEIDVALSFTDIRSPLAGIVSDRYVEAGSLVQPGQPVATVYDPNQMRLDAAVPVRLVEHLAIGDQVNVVLERPATNTSGSVYRMVSEIDPRSRTQIVQILLDPVQTPILPGTFGRLQLRTDERTVVRIPEEALREIGQLSMVQLVRDDRALWHIVTTGATANGMTEILSGLSAGDIVLLHD